jgi:hypothetical protein
MYKTEILLRVLEIFPKVMALMICLIQVSFMRLLRRQAKALDKVSLMPSRGSLAQQTKTQRQGYSGQCRTTKRAELLPPEFQRLLRTMSQDKL